MCCPPRSSRTPDPHVHTQHWHVLLHCCLFSPVHRGAPPALTPGLPCPIPTGMSHGVPDYSTEPALRWFQGRGCCPPLLFFLFSQGLGPGNKLFPSHLLGVGSAYFLGRGLGELLSSLLALQGQALQEPLRSCSRVGCPSRLRSPVCLWQQIPDDRLPVALLGLIFQEEPRQEMLRPGKGQVFCLNLNAVMAALSGRRVQDSPAWARKGGFLLFSCSSLHPNAGRPAGRAPSPQAWDVQLGSKGVVPSEICGEGPLQELGEVQRCCCQGGWMGLLFCLDVAQRASAERLSSAFPATLN